MASEPWDFAPLCHQIRWLALNGNGGQGCDYTLTIQYLYGSFGQISPLFPIELLVTLNVTVLEDI